MIGSILWLIVKLILFYSIAFLGSTSFYLYLHQKVLPPHRTLQFPVTWTCNTGMEVDFGRGQREGGNFYLKNSSPSSAPVINSNVPYDLSLLLRYPDRREISDLGNLKIVMKLFRKHGQEQAGKIEKIVSLRYESGILRFVKDFISLPVSIWRDTGSERLERITLIKRLIDNDQEAEENYKDSQNFRLKTSNFNQIDKIEISINPLPSLHSLELEVLVNLSPLQHFLFYYRVPAAILVIGLGTGFLWFIISIYAFVHFIKIILGMKEEEIEDIIDLDEMAEFKMDLDPSINIVDLDSDQIKEDSRDDSVVSVSSIEFPPSESVANFIGELRQRKFVNKNAKGDSIFESESEFEKEKEKNDDDDDQNVPI